MTPSYTTFSNTCKVLYSKHAKNWLDVFFLCKYVIFLCDLFVLRIYIMFGFRFSHQTWQKHSELRWCNTEQVKDLNACLQQNKEINDFFFCKMCWYILKIIFVAIEMNVQLFIRANEDIPHFTGNQTFCMPTIGPKFLSHRNLCITQSFVPQNMLTFAKSGHVFQYFAPWVVIRTSLS
jgi:hypothetical protein